MLEPPTYVSIRISAYVDVSRLRARALAVCAANGAGLATRLRTLARRGVLLPRYALAVSIRVKVWAVELPLGVVRSRLRRAPPLPCRIFDPFQEYAST